MDTNAVPTLRRSEDIALDLLKFIAGHTNLKGSPSSTPGFSVQATTKPDDQVNQLFELYARCRQAVEAPVPSAKK